MQLNLGRFFLVTFSHVGARGHIQRDPISESKVVFHTMIYVNRISTSYRKTIALKFSTFETGLTVSGTASSPTGFYLGEP